MIRATVKGLLGRKLRTALTAFSIVLGVAMVTGAYVVTDTMLSAADKLEGASYSGADAAIQAKKAFTSDNGNGGSQVRPIPESLVQTVAAVPSVAVAHGEITDTAKLTKKNGDVIDTSGGPPFAVGFDADSPEALKLSPFKVKEGAFPTQPNEIAIDAGTADKEDYSVGDSIGASALGPVRQYKITGIVTFGGVDSLGNATVSVFSLKGAQELFKRGATVDSILVAGKPGTLPKALQDEIRPVLPPGVEVASAASQDRFDIKGLKSFLDIIKTALVAFGGIALFVGAFIIFNTLSITVAQRAREFGLLRMIGASRKQVLRSVLFEAAAIGLLASLIGMGLGLLLAKGLQAFFKSVGLELPSTGTVFETRTVIVALLVGVGVTVLAGLVPAIRATRIPPVAALREGGSSLVPNKQSRTALLIGAFATLLGLVLLCFGIFASGITAGSRLGTMGGGCLLLFVGVAVFSPRIARPLASGLGWPAARFLGASGRLARENAMRNPGRTATTAAALMIGVALVTFVAVLGQGLKSSFNDSLDTQLAANYVVTAQDGFTPFPPESAAALAKAPGVEAVTSIESDQVKAFGKKDSIDGIQPDSVDQLINYEWEPGSTGQALHSLAGDGAIVTKTYAKDHSLKVGSRIEVLTPAGDRKTLVVRGVQRPPEFDPLDLGKIQIAQEAYDQLFTNHRVRYVFANSTGSKDELKAALEPFPDAKLQTRGEFKDEVGKQINQFLSLLYVLLALSVIVSLFGIVNTLVLSVFERTREIGMLRAVGMTRRQVRRMIRQEAIVTALIGAVLGMVIGVFLSALVTQALSKDGLSFSLPVGSLIAFFVVAILAGMLAAILPARRASRLNVLQALQYE
jgi:putative ABC transport system permease protein